MLSEQELTKLISELKVFDKAKVELEQYPTDPLTAAKTLHIMVENGDLVGKEIADLGSGTGLLGLGALLLGALKVTFFDIDEDALDILEKNISYLEDEHGFHLKDKYEIICDDINYQLNYSFDTVVTNPPFGVQKVNADRVFLTKGMEFAPVIYGYFKTETTNFVSEFIQHYGFLSKEICRFDFRLGQTMDHHKKPNHVVDITLLRIDRK